jgi:hypothetical protein
LVERLRGVCRILRPDSMEGEAIIHNDDNDDEWVVSEALYRDRGYQPPFDDLEACLK